MCVCMRQTLVQRRTKIHAITLMLVLSARVI